MDAHPFGPWFDVELLPVVPAEHAGSAAGWLPFADFLAADVLAAQVDATRRRLQERGPLGESPAEVRAVASTVVLSIFSRFLSPAIGAEVAGLPGWPGEPDATWLRPAASGPPDLASLATARPPASPEEVLERFVRPLADAFAEQFGVPDQVLRGNAAAAVAGACDLVGGTVPSLRRRAGDVRARLLVHPWLDGTGNPRGRFVRTSCCLIHRLPVGFVCGNCPLVASDTPTARRLQGRPANS